MVTTLCFLEDPARTLREISRIVRHGGAVIVGFVDADSPLGRQYREASPRSLFYRDAVFYPVQAVMALLAETGWSRPEAGQTLFSPVEDIRSVEPARPGWGEGSFVVLRATN